MSALKGFVAAFCGGCIVFGLISILVPKGNMSKTVKYAISLAFLCAVLAVSVGLSRLEMPEISVQEKDFSDERLSAATARMIFAQALSENGIKFSKINVFTDKFDSGGINISKVCVYTSESVEKVSAVIGSKDYELVVLNE